MRVAEVVGALMTDAKPFVLVQTKDWAVSPAGSLVASNESVVDVWAEIVLSLPARPDTNISLNSFTARELRWWQASQPDVPNDPGAPVAPAVPAEPVSPLQPAKIKTRGITSNPSMTTLPLAMI
jgi:hypothetical protein